MKKQLTSVIVLFFGALLLLQVGTIRANSWYSRSGIGIMRHYVGASAVGMGGTGIAVVNTGAVQYFNPAMMAFVPVTRFDGSFLYENAGVKLSNKSGRFANSSFNSVQVALPIKAGYGLGFGLLPYSSVSYKFSTPITVDEDQATQTITGAGGLEKAFLQFGGRIGSRFAYGAGMDVYFGRIESTWRLLFDSSSYEATKDVVSSYLRGIGFHTGLVVRLSTTFNAGAVFYFPTNLHRESVVSYRFGAQSDKQFGTIKLPLGHGYGLSFRPTARLHLAADVFLQSWGKIGAENIFASETVDSYRGAVGVEVQPSREVYAPRLQRLTYRFGAVLSKLPFLDATGNDVTEKYVSLGLGIPYYQNRGQIDIGFEIGRRGSLSKNIAEENVFRIVIGLSSGERWFSR